MNGIQQMSAGLNASAATYGQDLVSKRVEVWSLGLPLKIRALRTIISEVKVMERVEVAIKSE